ncbi:DUF2971 domain-containing protein [Halarcobacter sp.]|uniref:DUF2971 domain-containing protein n=1 Tax=Halarcobacter sp. TaxID=2321133 RepID=UPI003A901180
MLLYKYRKFDKEERTWDIIRNNELYFSSFRGFNDPFDCNLDFKIDDDYTSEDIDKFKNRISERRKIPKSKLDKGLSLEEYAKELKGYILDMKEKSGILSMSCNCKNILMWSHYADNHKGLCFGFSFDSQDKCFSKGSPVKYSNDDEYLPINVFAVEYEKELTRLFTIKSKYWEYEEEFRFITINSKGLKRFSKQTLKEIIFGCKASKENIKTTIQLCNDNGFQHIQFKKAKKVINKFELEFENIKKEDYLLI